MVNDQHDSMKNLKVLYKSSQIVHTEDELSLFLNEFAETILDASSFEFAIKGIADIANNETVSLKESEANAYKEFQEVGEEIEKHVNEHQIQHSYFNGYNANDQKIILWPQPLDSQRLDLVIALEVLLKVKQITFVQKFARISKHETKDRFHILHKSGITIEAIHYDETGQIVDDIFQREIEGLRVQGMVNQDGFHETWLIEEVTCVPSYYIWVKKKEELRISVAWSLYVLLKKYAENMVGKNSKATYNSLVTSSIYIVLNEFAESMDPLIITPPSFEKKITLQEYKRHFENVCDYIKQYFYAKKVTKDSLMYVESSGELKNHGLSITMFDPNTYLAKCVSQFFNKAGSPKKEAYHIERLYSKIYPSETTFKASKLTKDEKDKIYNLVRDVNEKVGLELLIIRDRRVSLIDSIFA